MADTGVYLPSGTDKDAVKAVAARIVKDTRILYSIDDEAYEYPEYSVAVDLHIKDYAPADRDLLMNRAVELRESLKSELGVLGILENELTEQDLKP
jgi:hypothetical protein